MISHILFDLDGTLLDSAKDLHACLCKVLAAHHQPNISLETVQLHLNVGAVGFLKLAFGEGISPEKLEALREEFLQYYEDLIFEGQTHFFPGTIEVLNQLEKNNLRWGVVTNKRERFTRPILKNLGLLDKASVIICADHVKQAKPSPEPLYLACETLKTNMKDCCYVGDSLADMLAAKAAPMPGLLALWGYWRYLQYSIQNWPNASILHQPDDLLAWL
jgi:phosphoglycolate phosphatase